MDETKQPREGQLTRIGKLVAIRNHGADLAILIEGERGAQRFRADARSRNAATCVETGKRSDHSLATGYGPTPDDALDDLEQKLRASVQADIARAEREASEKRAALAGAGAR